MEPEQEIRITSPKMAATPPYGLKWITSTFDLEPQWTVLPDMSILEEIVRRNPNFTEDVALFVDPYAHGAFNQLYKIATDMDTWIMRVALPVDPHRKTASEVATMQFARSKSDAPLPEIFAYDASNESPLRFEWILMEYVPGQQLRDVSRKLAISKKQVLIQRLAIYQPQLWPERFHAIGDLYENDRCVYGIADMVSMTFFWRDRGLREVSRGPFRNSHEWLSARLSLVREDQERVLRASDDEDDIEVAQRAKAIAGQLEATLAQIFPPDEDEETVLFHDDVNDQNILVDSHGEMAALPDWECVSALPLWKACTLPRLLEGRTRDEEPDRATYAKFDPNVVNGTEEEHEGVSQLYWEHLEDYERGRLRTVSLTEMERLAPDWVRQFWRDWLKQDFELAVLYCDSELAMKTIENWLAAYKRGQPHSLRDALWR